MVHVAEPSYVVQIDVHVCTKVQYSILYLLLVLRSFRLYCIGLYIIGPSFRM